MIMHINQQGAWCNCRYYLIKYQPIPISIQLWIEECGYLRAVEIPLHIVVVGWEHI